MTPRRAPATAPRGRPMPKTKLSGEDVRLIRELLEERERVREAAAELTIQKIADKFEVDRTTITRIGNGRYWKEVV